MTRFEVKVERAWTAGSSRGIAGKHHSQSERSRLVNLCPNPLGRPAVPVVRPEALQPLLVNMGSNTDMQVPYT